MNQRWLLLLLVPALSFAQARIETVRVIQRGDTLEVRYALRNPTPLDSVFLRVRTRENALLPARSLTGDVGRIRSKGSEKILFWNMNADAITLDADVQAEVLVKTAVPAPDPKPASEKGKPVTRQPGGGPEYALLSVVAPGVGNVFVQSRKPNGRLRVGLRPAVTVAFYGLLGYGIWQNGESKRAYDTYRSLPKESLAQPFFETANAAHHRYYVATRLAAALWLTDVTATLLRGLKNQRRRSEVALSPGFGHSGAPTVLTFRRQF